MCDDKGEYLTYMGACSPSNREEQLCLLHIPSATQIDLDVNDHLSGIPTWEGDQVLFPRYIGQASEVVQLHKSGKLTARYSLPVTAVRVERDPAQSAFILSTAEKAGLWRWSVVDQELSLLNSNIGGAHGSLWDVGDKGLLYVENSAEQPMLIMEPWDEGEENSLYSLGEITLRELGRLDWNERRGSALFVRVERPLLQIRSAGLD